MRAAPFVLLLCLACSERSKPNTPRDAVRGFGAALAEFDYDAIQPFVTGDEADREHLAVFFDWCRVSVEFRSKFLAAYGDDGWAEFNDNEEANVSITQNRNIDRFDHVRYEIKGDTAVGVLPNDPQKLHLVSDGRRWSIDLRKTMGYTGEQLSDNTRLYSRLADAIRDATPRIGAEGVTPAGLDTELAAKFEAAFREAGRIR